MKRFRSILFWGHLIAGVSAGVVILIMSATGTLLAFQPQILAWLERDVRRVEVSGTRLPSDAIVAAAMAARPSAQPALAAFESDPQAAVSVNFGRDGTIWVDPYSGRVLGEGATSARAFFQSMTEWHRWLAIQGESRVTARAITGASNFAFLLLALSGLYLWMPRKWSWRNVRAVAWFQRTGTARARDFNWHNAIGLWCAPAIIVMSATAVVMSYPWANRLVYQLAGTPLPVQQRPAGPGPAGAPAEGGGRGQGPARAGEGREGRGGGEARNARRAPTAPTNVDAAIARASETMPTWKSITMRFAPRPDGPLSLTLVDGAYWNAYARSTLTVDSATGTIAKWEPYTAQSRGQKWRGWIRFGHTGELGGITGQTIAGVACLGGVFLVYTGISLAIRRLFASRWFKKPVKQPIAASVLLMLGLGAAASSANAQESQVGILLLAHGGSASWNATVRDLSKELDAKTPTETALGMAQRAAIQSAVDKLVARGVTEIAAVPLFVSSHSSVVESTRFLLGLRADAPKDLAIFAKMNHGAPAGEHAMHGDANGTAPVTSPVPIRMGGALDRHALVGEILATRAQAISADPRREVVILVAHGPVPDADNALWLADMDVLAQRVATSAPYARVERLTVRDDAPAPVRDEATALLRATVQRAQGEGYKALIVPHLLSYGGIEQGIRKRLDGLDFVMAPQAIMPDARVERWALESAGLKTR